MRYRLHRRFLYGGENHAVGIIVKHLSYQVLEGLPSDSRTNRPGISFGFEAREKMDAFANLALGFSISLQPMKICCSVLSGCTRCRRRHPTGSRICGDNRSVASHHVFSRHHVCNHHVVGHLVRLDVQRIHHIDLAAGTCRSASVMVAIDGYEMTKQGRAEWPSARQCSAHSSLECSGWPGWAFGADACWVRLVSGPLNILRSLLGLTLVAYRNKFSDEAVAVTIVGLLLGCVGLDQFAVPRVLPSGRSRSNPASSVPMVMGLFRYQVFAARTKIVNTMA